MLFIDTGVTDNCQNLQQSYGEICVKCNKCGRFDEAIRRAKDDNSRSEKLPDK